MSNTFVNWTSRVAIAGRVAEQRRADNWNELPMLGDYHLPFGKVEAKTEAAKWLCQVLGGSRQRQTKLGASGAAAVGAKTKTKRTTP
jgi:hypothetical protein